jgi:hypothetical protein
MRVHQPPHLGSPLREGFVKGIAQSGGVAIIYWILSDDETESLINEHLQRELCKRQLENVVPQAGGRSVRARGEHAH